MTQKQLITANNAELEKHKQDILSLPMADDVKNGKWVWGKYEVKSQSYVNPTITAIKESPLTMAFSSEVGIDFTKVDKSFLVGFVKSDGWRFEEENSRYIKLVNPKTGESRTGLHFYQETGKIDGYVPAFYDSCFGEYKYDGVKQTLPQKTFLGYTVSDSETAYPDGGEKDGFWWERVKGARKGILFESINTEGFPTKATIDMDMDIVSTTDGFSYLTKIMSFLEDLTVGLKHIRNIHIGSVTKCRRVKVLRNCETIEINGFSGLGSESTITPKVFIPNTVKDIIGYTNGSLAFQNANKNTKIYCESPSKPSNWDNYWNYANASTALSVMWGTTESQFDAL